MSPKLIFLLLVISYVSSSTQDGDELIPPRVDVYESGKIYDITHRVSSRTLSGIYVEGIGEYLTLYLSMRNGSDYNFSIIKLPAHSGTHVDAPGHFYENYYQAGFDIDSLDLEVLNGIRDIFTYLPLSLYFQLYWLYLVFLTMLFILHCGLMFHFFFLHRSSIIS